MQTHFMNWHKARDHTIIDYKCDWHCVIIAPKQGDCFGNQLFNCVIKIDQAKLKFIIQIFYQL